MVGVFGGRSGIPEVDIMHVAFFVIRHLQSSLGGMAHCGEQA